jgi:hypothetical protein
MYGNGQLVSLAQATNANTLTSTASPTQNSFYDKQSCCSFRQRGDITHVNLALRMPCIISRLHPQPNLWAIPEQLTEKNSNLGRHWLLFSHDRMKVLAGNAEKIGNLTHRTANAARCCRYSVGQNLTWPF